MNLSDHFTLDEACFSSVAERKGISNRPDQVQLMNMHEAAECLEQVRKLLNAPIHVDSWLRVPMLNSAVGGSKTSAHMSGWAIDFICPDYGTPEQIVKAIIAAGIEFDQCICEGGWVHISFAPEMRQEVLTAKFTNGVANYTKGMV